MDIQEITQQVEKESVVMRQIMAEVQKIIVGQSGLLDRMLIGLLCDGHLLLEGLPGLAKTTAVKTLATAIKTSFQRIQFTPDLLPADISAPRSIDRTKAPSRSKKAPFSTISFWPTKSTGPRPKFRVPCWKPCRNVR